MRKRREVDPTLTILRDCVIEAEKAGAHEKYAKQRLADLLDFFETTSSWYEQIRRMPTGAVIKFIQMGDKLRKMIGAA